MIKCAQTPGMTNFGQNNNKKNEYIKLGILGINQITSDERKKLKPAGNNPKSMLSIQNAEYKTK